jgi:hypothetical protein
MSDPAHQREHRDIPLATNSGARYRGSAHTFWHNREQRFAKLFVHHGFILPISEIAAAYACVNNFKK